MKSSLNTEEQDLTYSQQESQEQHEQSSNESDSESEIDNDEKQSIYYCNLCKKYFTCYKSLRVHQTKSSNHYSTKLDCDGCGKVLLDKTKYNRHILRCKKLQILLPDISESQSSQQLVPTNAEVPIYTAADLQNERKLMVAEMFSQLSAKETTNTVIKNITNVNTFIQNNTIINCENVIKRVPCVKDNEIANLLKEAPFESFDSYDSLGRYISKNYLHNRLVTTDSSRNVVSWKDEHSHIIKDPGALEISRKITNLSPDTTYEINKKIKDRKGDLNLSNTAEVTSYTNKIATYNAMKTQSQNFNQNLGKVIAKCSTKLSSMQALPDVTIESFIGKVKQFFTDFGHPLHTYDCTGFLHHFMEDFALNKKTIDNESCFFTLQYMLQTEKSINFFVLNKVAYFLDDSNNIYADKKCATINNIILTFLKDNILKNATRSNKASFFRFTETDIVSLYDKPEDFSNLLHNVFGTYF